MSVQGYVHIGGRHARSTALRNVLAHAGLPLSEPMVFGLAGGIGAGYSFCPSVVRHGNGSGISIVGRHKSYATGPNWYTGILDRLGVKYRITESAAPKKAQQNLRDELNAGRPAMVWCGRSKLTFMPNVVSADLWMHEFAVYGVDDAKQLFIGSDRSNAPVTISFEALADARNAVCTHKNRTLTIEPTKPASPAKLREAVQAALTACASELLDGRMKTFSLPGLALWADRIANTKNSKEGWPRVFGSGLMFDALLDAFDSIETSGCGGGLFRPLFADFLAEAGHVSLAMTYRALGQQWTALADDLLPDRVVAFKKVKSALHKRDELFATKGQAADARIAAEVAKIASLTVDCRKSFPLDAAATADHMGRLSDTIGELHRAEVAAAEALVRRTA
ncbi:MAG: BtrH N-terminal domain-containing protein [Gemmataceae bacterium]